MNSAYEQSSAASQNQSETVSHPQFDKDWFIIGWFIFVHAAALIGPWFATSPGAIVTAVVLYYVTGCLGITLGYHRLLAHRSFKAPVWVERVLATCGVLALQRSPLEWVGHHRMHHAYSDTPKDPHDATRGFWWSHIGWMCHDQPDISDHAKLRKFARDIVADPYLNWLSSHTVQVMMQVALGIALIVLGGWDYMIWGIWVRLAVVYHTTWFVNSATHQWGYQNYKCDDLSSNLWWVGILAFGEGWHNNHHAQPDVAPAQRKWWEFDLTWQIIKGMRLVGLAHSVKMPPARVVFEAPKAPGIAKAE
jgi:stearoyl-CoA desaturase (delta-9 desaturase)